MTSPKRSPHVSREGSFHLPVATVRSDGEAVAGGPLGDELLLPDDPVAVELVGQMDVLLVEAAELLQQRVHHGMVFVNVCC